MANETIEIKGSHGERMRGNQELKERLFASTDGTTDVPVRGDAFDEGAVDITDHVCLAIDKELDTRLPGVWYIRCLYAKFIPYA